MALEKSPLAPERFPDLPAVGGVQIAGRACGLKRSGAKDLMLAALAPGTAVAGVFTRSLCSSAPVDWCRAALPGGRARAIVCNSGNANAFTGKAGDTTAERTAAAAAALFGCPEQEVFLASTGVIGVPVKPDHIGDCLPGLARHLSAGAWQDAAEAIMTTDTFPKGAGAQTAIGGTPVSIAGFAKGSGMIAPDMATMLGFVFTDADIPAPLLQKLLARSNDRSFNAITVDGDTSTSDTVLLCATGAAGNAPPADLRAVRDFERALDSVMIDLAQQIVRDGEGATNPLPVTASGAADYVLEADTIGHPEFHPDDAEWLRYAGPYQQRIWVARRDGSEQRLAYRRDAAAREWIVHETWRPGTREIGTTRWPHGMIGIDVDTGAVRRVCGFNIFEKRT